MNDVVDLYLMDRVRSRELSHMAARNARSTLYQFVAIGPPRPEQITKRHVERWLESKANLTDTSRRQQLSQVRVFCDWLVRRGRLPTNPAEGMTHRAETGEIAS